MAYINVLGSKVMNCVLSDNYYIIVITKDGYFSREDTIVSKFSCHLQNLSTTASSSDILNFCCGYCYEMLFLPKPRDKLIDKKLESTICTLSIHFATPKVRVRVAN